MCFETSKWVVEKALNVAQKVLFYIYDIIEAYGHCMFQFAFFDTVAKIVDTVKIFKLAGNNFVSLLG